MFTELLLKTFLHIDVAATDAARTSDAPASASAPGTPTPAITDPGTRARVGSFAGTVGIICNTLLCGAKMAIGAVAGSVSIVADAVNNLSDAASNIISLLSFRLANRPPDKDHPYGHGRAEYLSGLIVAALIIVVGIELLKSSFEKLLNPQPVEFSWALVIVLALAIAVKLWMALFNKKLGVLIDSKTLEATSIDSRNDVISTAAVLAAALVSHFTGFELDAWMGLAVAAFIIYSGVGLIRETMDPLLGTAPSPAFVKHIEEATLAHEGVLGIHDLIVHDYGPGRVFASLHAEVPAETPVLESHEIIDAIEEEFRTKEGIEVVIHLDPIVTSDPRVAEMRHWLAGRIKEGIDPCVTIHDFRMVPGELRTNLIFDAVLPHGTAQANGAPHTPDTLRAAIQDIVTSEHPDCFCVIHVDREYV